MTLVSRPPLKARQTFPFDMVDVRDVAIDGGGNQKQEKEQLEREWAFKRWWIESFVQSEKKFWREKQRP